MSALVARIPEALIWFAAVSVGSVSSLITETHQKEWQPDSSNLKTSLLHQELLSVPNYAQARRPSAADGRFFGILSPFNPLNPFAALLTSTALQRKKGPIAATAVLKGSGGSTPRGTIHFFQANALSPMVVVGAMDYNFDTSSVNIDVRTNPTGAGAAASDCSEATMGAIFNPASVASGGQLGNNVPTRLGSQDLFAVFINDVSISRATLYGQNSIIGRGIRSYDIAAQLTAANQEAFLCGTIVEVV